MLLSPPLTSGTRTLRAVEKAAQVLGFESYSVANLTTIATRNSGDLASTEVSEAAWVGSRAQICCNLKDCTELLFAWGVLRHLGAARTNARAQIDWVLGWALATGYRGAWSVGLDIRHPSRWHQYISDKHGRTDGGESDERLRQVLVYREIGELRATLNGKSDGIETRSLPTAATPSKCCGVQPGR